MRICAARLWDSLMDMAKIGPGVRGGNNRQTVTDADKKGRDLFRRWCEEAGLSVAVDTMGNMFARREGTDAEALPVWVGSHIDTQPTGGRYDGVLGVLAGLELVRVLNDLDVKTKRPIEIVNWSNEEGTRFAPAMLASGVYAGMHEEDWAYARQDAKGLRFGDELERIGYRGSEPVGQRRPHSFFELHIEQGPILEAEDKLIGVVTHGQGLHWLEVTLTGKESHTGSTPMPMRKNAGRGAGASDGGRARDRHEPRAQRRRRHRPHRRLSEQPQHHPRPGRLHGRRPLVGPSHPRRHGGPRAQRSGAHRGTSSASATRSSRPAISTPSPSTRAASRPSGAPPSASAIRTATSSPAPATTPAGSTAWPPPPWSCAPAWMGSAITRTRRSRGNGRRRGRTC